MEANKENVYRVKSRIPLPLDPLPRLPKSLLKRHNEDRVPLRIINGEQSNINTARINGELEHVERNTLKAKTPINVDSRHVTVRHQTDDLDWDYQVFKDDIERVTKVNKDIKPSTSDQSDNTNNSDTNNAESNEYNAEIIEKVVTPVIKSPILEPNRIKNIKKSLKRPHSRELQGLSPVLKAESVKENFKRRLEFQGRAGIVQTDTCDTCVTCLTREYTPELFVYLLEVEEKSPVPCITSTARACVINWLLKVNGPNGNEAVVQSAMWYLDSILTVSHIHIDQLQLVAAASYWIAQKLYGPSFTAKKLVKCSSHAFTAERLVATEKAILYKLKFPNMPIVPQDYITYFSWYCDNSCASEIEAAATFLCMAGIMTNKLLCNEYPSVIGAAAVINAVILLDKRHYIVKLQRNHIFKDAEKKSSNMSHVCTLQRRAICRVSSPCYEYKTVTEHYSLTPHLVAQKVVHSANKMFLNAMVGGR